MMRSLPRILTGSLLAVALVLGAPGRAPAAGTTGTLQGHVVDATTKAPLGGVTVALASPSGSYSARTDASGFYAVAGVVPDTYTVTFQFANYELANVTGVTIVQDQLVTLDQPLARRLTTIGRTSARSASSAFQPKQTTDSYTITGNALTVTSGKADNVSETTLLRNTPGATLTSTGRTVLRGGRQNQTGFQFEGISYVEPATNQFANSLQINGLGSFQVTPGAGNASQGNSGTGGVNILLKRGTRPPFGLLDFEVSGPAYSHQFGAEYGFATPNGRFSQYLSFIGFRNGNQDGPVGTPAAPIGAYFDTVEQDSNDIVSNTVFRFGKDNRQSLQLVYQAQIARFVFDYGGAGLLYYPSGDPQTLNQTLIPLSGITGNAAGIAALQALTPLLPGQASPTGFIDRPAAQFQPNQTYKIEYANQLNSSTFLRAATYHVNAIVVFDLNDPGDGGVYQTQGGVRTGYTLDLQRQLGDKHQIQAGARYEYSHAILDGITATNPIQLLTGGFSGLADGYELADFLPANSALCPKFVKSCGYLFGKYANGTPFFPNGVPGLPAYDRHVPFDRGDFALYFNDTWTVNPKITLDYGLRLDGYSKKYIGGVGVTNIYPISADRAFTNPYVYQPRFAFSYQFGARDTFRASYGRSVSFTPLSNEGSIINPSDLQPFVGIPSYDALTGKPAAWCGPPPAGAVIGNQPCADYADQIFWQYQSRGAGPAPQPIKPETFSNIDASYAHQFPNGTAFRVTPFYRRGYNVSFRTNQPLRDASGNPITNPVTGAVLFTPNIASNNGVERTTGVEFAVTRDRPYGFAYNITGTYLNSFSNVIPRTSREDFFPTVPASSLALGNLYRSGLFSPLFSVASLQYKFRSGLRINPQITYNHGYPLGNGLIGAGFINNVPYNIPFTDAAISIIGRTGAPLFVDPANPGSFFRPNVAARLGTPDTAAAGGFLSNARLTTNLTIEFAPENAKNTIGLRITNLFNQVYSRPAINNIQPVATGVYGPATGQLTSANYIYSQPGANFNPSVVGTPASYFGTDAYFMVPSGAPLTTNLYYQIKL